jgi:hypothetical protein
MSKLSANSPEVCITKFLDFVKYSKSELHKNASSDFLAGMQHAIDLAEIWLSDHKVEEVESCA